MYEEQPQAKIALLATALTQLQRFDDGTLTVAALSKADFDQAEAADSDAEGIIDQLRAIQQTEVAALAREVSNPRQAGQHKVSLRATDENIDVSVIARALGGGGHPRAAGFTTTLTLDELTVLLRQHTATQLDRGLASGNPHPARELVRR